MSSQTDNVVFLLFFYITFYQNSVLPLHFETLYETAQIRSNSVTHLKTEFFSFLIPQQEAIAANSYLCEDLIFERGDVSVGFSASDYILSRELYTGGQVSVSTAPHSEVNKFYHKTQIAIKFHQRILGY